MIDFPGNEKFRILRQRLHRLLVRDPFLVAIGPRVRWGADLSGHGFEAIRAPRGRFYADPFLVQLDGAHYLFVEDADVETKIGVISCMRIASDGKPGEAEVVLKRNYHVSYPFVFRWRGEFYMIPETERNHTIEIYRAHDFPRGWELVKVLFHHVRAVDATLFEYRQRFWLFTAMSDGTNSLNEELFLFHSNSPLGEWVAHPKNPVIADVRRARPAGAVFIDGGEIIRPGQDCSRIYGGAITLNRIEILSEADYRECPVGRIDPDWRADLVGTHTINSTGELSAIAGKHLAWRWRA